MSINMAYTYPKELEKAKKRRQREHLAEQKRQARAYAEAHEFDDEELQPVDLSFEAKKAKPKNKAAKKTVKSKGE